MKSFKIRKIYLAILFNIIVHYTIFAQLEKGDVNRFTKIEPPTFISDPGILPKTATATFDVNFSQGMPEQAKQAFNYAVSIWNKLLNTNITIKIDVQWKDLGGSGPLAGTMVEENAWFKDFTGVPLNINYPSALANSIADQVLGSNEYDIKMEFNSNTQWYYGIDGNTPVEHHDLATTALHEIAHGLGFSSSFDGSGQEGKWGMSNNFPKIFDNYVIKSPGSERLIDSEIYDNPSENLKDALISGQVYFDGQYALDMNFENPPKLFAPTSWESGSSIAHLDESSYPAGNTNSLMTKALDKAEAIHSPGEITLGILQDLGWGINRLVTVENPGQNITWNQGITKDIRWSDTEETMLEISLIDVSGNFVSNIASYVNSYRGVGNVVNWPIPTNLPNGQYKIKFHAVLDFNDAYGVSVVFTISNLPNVAEVTIFPATTTFNESVDVTLECATNGAEIYYTLDGSEPDETKTLYPNTPINITSTKTVRARAYKDNYNSSVITQVTYVKSSSNQNITLFPKGGDYRINRIRLHMFSNVDGGEIRFTTNGAEPTISSTLYQNYYDLYGNTTIKAKVFLYNQPVSETVTETYNCGVSSNNLISTWIEQKDNSNQSFGNLSLWSADLNEWMEFGGNLGDWVELPNNHSFTFLGEKDFKTGTTEKFYNISEQNFPEKYYRNHSHLNVRDDGNDTYMMYSKTSPAYNASIYANLEGVDNIPSSYIEFKDPWFINEGNENYNNAPYGYRNFGMDENLPWESRQSPFFHTTNSEYKGVFLNQTYDPSKPFYSVRVPQTQTVNIDGSDYIYNFVDWSLTDAILTTPTNVDNEGYVSSPVIFIATNAEVKANYKGINLTNYLNAYEDNGSHKFIESNDGYGGNTYLHNVYESMGKIWHEVSYDNGSTWELANNGVSLGEGKSPSIGYLGTEVIIVYSTGYGISSVCMDLENGKFVTKDTEILEDFITPQPDMKPVINVGWSGSDGKFLVVYKYNNNLYCKSGMIIPGTNDITGIGSRILVPNTNSDSKNVTLTGLEVNSSTCHLAWEQYVNSYDTEIRYHKITVTNPSSISFSNYYIPSDGAGFVNNIQPSILIKQDNSIRLFWVGIPWSGYQSDRRVVVRARYSTNSWGSSFGNYGQYVTKVNANIDNNESSLAYSWVEEIYGSKINRFRTTGMSWTGTLSTNGVDVQVSNGASLDNMYVMAFNTNSTPFNFNMTNSLGSLNKSNTTNFVGRKGILNKDKVEYFCTLSDVDVEDELIAFVDINDHFNTDSVEIMNSYLLTEEFKVKPESKINFSLNYGVNNQELALEQLAGNGSVIFLVKLLDAQNNNVISTLEEIILNKNTKTFTETKFYEIEPKLTKNMKVKLGILIKTNLKTTATCANIEVNSPILKKQKDSIIENIELEIEKIDKYKLFQNYPNPFNPFTTINYQVPNDGYTSIKIYDAVGKEVATLVNEYKSTGRYSVIFDGTGLSSGIYFYSITAGDFKDTKKLILLK